MFNYDQDDAAVKLVDSLYITHDAAKMDEVALDINKVISDVTLDLDVVVNQARQACTCVEELKRLVKKGLGDYSEGELCLPCEARFALNAVRAVAEKG